MKTRVVLLTAVCLGAATVACADGELVYPWDNPPPAPGADCLDVPCVPCVFSLPGLRAAGLVTEPCRAVPAGPPAASGEPEEVVAAADLPATQ